MILTILLKAVFCMAASTVLYEDVANFEQSAFSGQAHATVNIRLDTEELITYKLFLGRWSWWVLLFSAVVC